MNRKSQGFNHENTEESIVAQGRGAVNAHVSSNKQLCNRQTAASSPREGTNKCTEASHVVTVQVNQVKSSQVKSSQFKSSQFKSSQVRTECVKQPMLTTISLCMHTGGGGASSL